MRSTLKITSAMKLVAASELRKVQRIAETLIPYAEALDDIMATVGGGPTRRNVSSDPARLDVPPVPAPQRPRTAIVAVASNNSLCGAFNVNVIRHALAEAAANPGAVLFPVGRKMTDALRAAGYAVDGDRYGLIAKPTYEAAAEFAAELLQRCEAGEFDRVLLVYTHYHSAGVQKPTTQVWLPFGEVPASAGMTKDSHSGQAERDPEPLGESESPATKNDTDYIIEPSPEGVVERIMPLLLRLQIYTMLLDSAQSEQAARTIAMQAASDNAEDLLAELTLEYNKSRQQKITAEILDLVAASEA